MEITLGEMATTATKSKLERLAQRLKEGDASALEPFISRTQEAAFGVAISYLKDRHLAQDVLQDAYLLVYQKIGQLERPEAVKGWFFQIVRSCCHRHLRKQRPEQSIERLDSEPSHQPSWEERLTIEQTFQKLGPDHRAILTLREVGQLSYQEIATSGLGAGRLVDQLVWFETAQAGLSMIPLLVGLWPAVSRLGLDGVLMGLAGLGLLALPAGCYALAAIKLGTNRATTLVVSVVAVPLALPGLVLLGFFGRSKLMESLGALSSERALGEANPLVLTEGDNPVAVREAFRRARRVGPGMVGLALEQLKGWWPLLIPLAPLVAGWNPYLVPLSLVYWLLCFTRAASESSQVLAEEERSGWELLCSTTLTPDRFRRGWLEVLLDRRWGELVAGSVWLGLGAATQPWQLGLEHSLVAGLLGVWIALVGFSPPGRGRQRVSAGIASEVGG